MWKKGRGILSAFAGMNQGEIRDCHAKLSRSSEEDIQPFCSQNKGIIITVSGISDEKMMAYHDMEEGEPRYVIEVRSAGQLQEICKQVNLGDSFYCNGYYRLENDLDMHGMKWIPMGISAHEPFCGVFDGNGYSIKNINVKGNLKGCSGFFGYLKQAVVKQLSIEGRVTGGVYTGAFAGVVEDSDITSCFASAHVYGRHYTGGFVGMNSGRIQHCYWAGVVANRKAWIV